MRKSYQLDEIDCAVCAAKLQDALAALPGVESVEVNYILQKLTVTAPDAEFDAVMKSIRKTTRKIEPDCEIIG